MIKADTHLIDRGLKELDEKMKWALKLRTIGKLYSYITFNNKILKSTRMS